MINSISTYLLLIKNNFGMQYYEKYFNIVQYFFFYSSNISAKYHKYGL